jgi:hypothetical protein
VVLKGSSWVDIQYQAGIILLFGIVLNAMAIFNYRKTS